MAYIFRLVIKITVYPEEIAPSRTPSHEKTSMLFQYTRLYQALAELI
jgi:hypothetical protein